MVEIYWCNIVHKFLFVKDFEGVAMRKPCDDIREAISLLQQCIELSWEMIRILDVLIFHDVILITLRFVCFCWDLGCG